MPQQPAPPVIIEPPVQEVPVPVYYPVGDNRTDITDNNDSNSKSVSEAENYVTQSASLSAYQVNSNHEATYFKYKNGTVVPGTSVYADFNVINDRYGGNRYVGQIGIRHTFGGKAKNTALLSMRLQNMRDTFEICQAAGYFKGDFEIDFKMLPELQECEYIQQRVIAEKPSEISILKQQIREQQKLIQEMKKTNEAFQLRLIQMQNSAKVRVGG